MSLIAYVLINDIPLILQKESTNMVVNVHVDLTNICSALKSVKIIWSMIAILKPVKILMYNNDNLK